MCPTPCQMTLQIAFTQKQNISQFQEMMHELDYHFKVSLHINGKHAKCLFMFQHLPIIFHRLMFLLAACTYVAVLFRVELHCAFSA